MTQAWLVVFETYTLTIAVSFLVAFLIHMMTTLIRRFGVSAHPLPVHAEEMEAGAIPDDPDELAAIAIAIAMRRSGEGR